jgi:hypothetical protein
VPAATLKTNGRTLRALVTKDESLGDAVSRGAAVVEGDAKAFERLLNAVSAG